MSAIYIDKVNVKSGDVKSLLGLLGEDFVVPRDFVYEKFAEYYKSSSETISPPLLFDQREFGFFLLKEKIMLRHKSFGKKTDLKSFLSEAVPSDVYHSCAYYENPDFEMSKKGWRGSDLVFDIDADHIPTPCNKIHDEWSCGKCSLTGKGITPDVCPACGGMKFDTRTWPCELCLQSAKEETEKLVAMLEEDFGFSPEEIHTFFSGHRGYHVHVETESVRTLDAAARKEIVDYVSGLGLMLLDEDIEKKGSGRRNMNFFDFQDFGWRRRLKVGMEKFIMNATKEDLKAIRIRSYNVLKNRETISWMRLARHIRDLESAKIDTVVTTDLHRLIRMAGTLHGKTGLLKVEFPTSKISSFDPFKEAVAFKKGTARVSVSSAPEFRLCGEVFGPYRNQTVELSTAAAVLLVCKKRAKVAQN